MPETVGVPDDAITLTEAGKLLRGRCGRPPCLRSLRRWVTQGIMSRGRRVYLRAVRVHGQYLTCPAWVAEFEAVRVEEVIPVHQMVRSRREESAAVARARQMIRDLAPGRR